MGEGAWGKVLRTCSETGAWTVLFKQAAGTHAPPHKHLAGADFYVLAGRIEYPGGVATAGCFAREPMNAIHDRTEFPDETIYCSPRRVRWRCTGPMGRSPGSWTRRPSPACATRSCRSLESSTRDDDPPTQTRVTGREHETVAGPRSRISLVRRSFM